MYTLAKEGEYVSAFAVRDTKILATGSDEDIRRIPAKEIIDLQGKTVLPGFIETHCHMADFAEDLAKVNLESARCIDDIVNLLKAQLENTPSDGWITGYQANLLLLKEQRLPNRYDLDRVSTEIPVFISSIDKHNFIVNSKALALSKIDERFLGAPEAKFLEFDANGKVTGRLKEHGMLHYINNIKPSVFNNDASMLAYLETSLKDFAAKGYTTVHSFGGFNQSALEQPKAYQKLEATGRLPLRIILNNEPGVNRPELLTSGFGTEKVKYGAVKFFIDGSLMQWSAYLKDDYSDKPGYRGLLVKNQEELAEAINEAYDNGNDIAAHAIGDGAIDVFLDIVEKIKAADTSWDYSKSSSYSYFKEATGDNTSVTNGMLYELIKHEADEATGDNTSVTSSHTYSQHACNHHTYSHHTCNHQQLFRLIHCTLSRPDQWERIAKLGVIIDSQPVFIPLVATLGRQRLGNKRANHMLAFRSWIDKGIIVTAGDDAPICDHNPFVGIRSAVLREDGFNGEQLNAKERVSVYEAIQMYTVNAAICSHEQDSKGCIQPGKLADFIVIDKDVFQIPAKDISNTKVLATYLGGVLQEVRP
ncbi:MAG: amidohydrolase [Coriobacteriales bacterium]|nr:amidohydrolase [Coriobacteriales bacterium]